MFPLKDLAYKELIYGLNCLPITSTDCQVNVTWPGISAYFNIKAIFPGIRIPIEISRPAYLYDGNTYPGKTAFLYQGYLLLFSFTRNIKMTS